MKKGHGVAFTLLTVSLFMIWPTVAVCETIKLGVLLHLSGELQSFGEMQKKSLLIAMEDLKEQNNKGRKVELVFQDMPVSPEQVGQVVRDMIDSEKIAMIICSIASSHAWEAALAAQSEKVPILITAATEDRITEQGWDYVFRLTPPLKEYGNGLLWFLTEVVKPKTIAVLRAKNYAGMANASEMLNYSRKAGFEIIFDQVYQDTVTDFRPILRQLEDKKPHVIVMASYLNDAVNIMKQSRELDLRPMLFVGLGGGFTLPQFGELAPDASNYVFAVSDWEPSVPYPGSNEYYDHYQKHFKTRPDFHGAETYAGLQVALNATARAEPLDREGLRNALLLTDMTSIIGPVKFVSYGKKERQNRLPTYLIQWIDGEMVTVWPPGLACRKYVFPFPGW